MLGTTEVLLIGAVALLVFGGKKVPELMKGLGQGVKEFKKGMNGSDEMLSNDNENKEEQSNK
jgi:sec-independent protein translocase protein TatA